MIHNECRLKKVFFYIFFEEQIQNITFFMSFFKFKIVCFRKFSCLFKSFYFVPVNTCIFLNSINHCDTLERLSEIHLDSFIYNLSSSKNFLCNKTVQVLCQIHHAMIVCVCLVKFHQSEFRVMSCIKTFVTEYTSNLIYSFQTTNDQSLQIKFQRDTELQVFVQGVEMCLERSCSCSSGILYKHRSLYFHKAFISKIFTDCGKDLGTFNKSILYFRVHDQIHISLTITGICICQSVELLRKDLQTL